MHQANFGAALGKEQSTTVYTAVRHHYAHQHRKGASEQRKARYDRLADSAGFHESDQVCFYRSIRTRVKSPKLQLSWEGPYIITPINDVVYRIQQHRKAKMTVVHLDRLAPYLGAARNE
jgi:hypothetical protein